MLKSKARDGKIEEGVNFGDDPGKGYCSERVKVYLPSTGRYKLSKNSALGMDLNQILQRIMEIRIFSKQQPCVLSRRKRKMEINEKKISKIRLHGK